MKTMTLALVAMLALGLVAAMPSASAAPMAADDGDGRCIGVYEEETHPDGSVTKKCTGVWEGQLKDLLGLD